MLFGGGGDLNGCRGFPIIAERGRGKGEGERCDTFFFESFLGSHQEEGGKLL